MCTTTFIQLLVDSKEFHLKLCHHDMGNLVAAYIKVSVTYRVPIMIGKASFACAGLVSGVGGE